MGGHNSYTFTRNASQLSYRPFKFSGESDSIKALRKEDMIKSISLVSVYKFIGHPPSMMSNELIYQVDFRSKQVVEVRFTSGIEFNSKKSEITQPFRNYPFIHSILFMTSTITLHQPTLDSSFSIRQDSRYYLFVVLFICTTKKRYEMK